MRPVLFAILLAAGSIFAADRPNIIIILADDLGYGDLSCYGHPSIRTPHLDRMAAEGLRFTNFYSGAEVCTPSRAALLTGRYPIRSGMCHDKFRVLYGNAVGGLPASEITLAEALKENGYATACIGKWHLGLKEEYNPRRHGFDYFLGLPHSNDMNPSPSLPKGGAKLLDQDPTWWDTPLYENEKIIEQPFDQRKLTKRYTDQAVKFIKQHKDRPFFVYLPHSFPHVPLFVSDKFRGKSPRGIYGDVVEELDWSVGEILDCLRDEKLENTLVFFTSDNGPWLTQDLAGGSAGLLKDGKGSTWEGGMRVPGIAWWPKKIKPGRLTPAMACNMDLFTTSIKLAGGEIPSDRPIDGIDLSPIFFDKKESVRDEFFFYRGATLFAARKGAWKAHFMTQPAYGNEAATKHDPALLYNLAVDPSEKFDVAAKHAEIIGDIAKAVDAHRATITPVENQLEAGRSGK